MKQLYRLIEILEENKKYYLFAGLLTLIAMFIRMLEPKVLQLVVDGIVMPLTNQTVSAEEPDIVAGWLYQFIPAVNEQNVAIALLSAAALYVVISLVRATSSFAGGAISAFYTEKSIKKLRDKMFAHIQHLPMTYHNKQNSGELIQRCTGDIDTIRRFISTQLVEMIRMSGIFVAAFLLMFMVHKVYALVAVSTVPIILLTSYWFFKKESEVWQEHEDEADKLTSIVNENLNGIRVVKAYANEDAEIEKFKKQNIAKRDIGLRQVNLHRTFWPISDILVHAQITMSIFFGGYLAVTNQITVGQLTSFYTYCIMVTWPMRQIGRIVSQMGMAIVALDRVQEVLHSKEEDYSGITEFDYKKASLTFNNVSFQYPNTETVALKNVSFTVKPGERIGIIGPAGSGKSTIIKLLKRFYAPTEGEILLDRTPIQKLASQSLRQNLASINQKPFLFSTSIANNIRHARFGADDNEVMRVAELSSLAKIEGLFIDGFETMVGEKGVTLSGGQKQRVVIARNLLLQAPILIIDDATSAIDTETEHYIYDNIEPIVKDKTVFIVSHRIAPIKTVDRVIVLNKGIVEEMGTPDELYKKGGFYQQMVDIQDAIEDEIQQELMN